MDKLKYSVLLISLLPLLVGCSKSDSLSDNLYPSNVKWGQELTESNSGIIYIDPNYCISRDGKEFVAFSRYTGQMIDMTDEEILNMRPGDDIYIDCNRKTTIEIISINNDWIPELSPNAINTADVLITRNPGRIDINDDYFFLHPVYFRYPDGHVDIEGMTVPFENTNSWVLYNSKGTACDDPIWVPIASDCVIYICKDGIRESTVDQKSFKTLLCCYDGIIESCYASGWFDDNGEVYELEVFIDESI